MRVQIEKRDRDRDRDRDRRKEKERSLSLVSVLILLFLFPSASFAGEAPWTVLLRSPEVFQGGVVEIKVLGGDTAGVKGFFRNQEIPFFREEDGSYAALLGVDLEEKPGRMVITIQGGSQDGGKSERLVTLRVRDKVFPRETLTTSTAFDDIGEATMKRIKEEQAHMTRLWGSVTPRRFWKGAFLSPVPGKITSPFGLRRIINGSPRSPHGGVDLKASLGTEIVAPNHGQVVLRDEFFFCGKSIVLDHGGGLYTTYCHLADFSVEKGSQVRKGDLIGWAGMTGRVTGPNLHWGVRLNGARVDPLELLKAAGDRQKAEGSRQ